MLGRCECEKEVDIDFKWLESERENVKKETLTLKTLGKNVRM